MAVTGEMTFIFTSIIFSLWYFNNLQVAILSFVLTTLIIVLMIEFGINRWMDQDEITRT